VRVGGPHVALGLDKVSLYLGCKEEKLLPPAAWQRFILAPWLVVTLLVRYCSRAASRSDLTDPPYVKGARRTKTFLSRLR
jgi:hypothetical protein